MPACLLLVPLWVVVWLCLLNSQPAYRRQNPCRLPEAGSVQRGLCLMLPPAGLLAACVLAGLDGLFLWVFTAPLTGILIGLACPLLSPSPRQRRSAASGRDKPDRPAR